MHVDLFKIKFDSFFYDKEERDNNIDSDYLENETADIFMNGACDIFAYCLKNKNLQYEIYCARSSDNGECHYFCVKDDKYIDARGVYDSIEEGLKHLNSNKIKWNKIDNYKPDFKYEWIKTLINFGNEIIKSNEPLYLVP